MLMDGTQQPDNSQGSWGYTPDEALSSQQPIATDANISWTASEFVAHHKSPGWYLILTAGAVVASILVYLVTHDIISSIVILFAALAFGVVGARQPRELAYRLDDYGLTIGSRQNSYGDFRSFSVMQEGAFSSIVFVPHKRFAPLTTIYYDPSDEQRIADMLSNRLPLQLRQNDAIDRLLWRIRF